MLLGWPAAALDVLANVRQIFQNDSERQCLNLVTVTRKISNLTVFMVVITLQYKIIHGILGTGIVCAVSHSKTMSQHARNWV